VKKILLSAFLAILLLSSSACLARPAAAGTPIQPDEKPAGFWLGLWHGLIAPFTFIVSLFDKDVCVYQAYNTGGWYLTGFIFGLLSFFGAGRGGGNRAWKKRRGR
jgi:hypothetical protein